MQIKHGEKVKLMSNEEINEKNRVLLISITLLKRELMKFEKRYRESKY